MYGILAVIAADLLTGSIHWMEDTFFTEQTPIIGKWLIEPNELHHRKPTAFLEKTWWENSWDAILVSLMIILIAILIHKLSWEVVVFAATGACATIIHKYAHEPRERIPKIIRAFQKIKLIQDGPHHMKHHAGTNNSNYCLITPFLNPILDYTHFWKILEQLLKPVLGEPRKSA
jgi:ubiquitin-conjugating enzyme E2 variant